MKILGIETSCDETAAAVVLDGTKILANVVSSSAQLHSKTGGIIPETAAREQVKAIIPVLEETFRLSRLSNNDIDAVAVTVGPGLIGSLLVGVEAAKTLSFVWKKPIVPINHLIGHIYGCFLEQEPPKFPFIALVVSGAHTDLLLVKNHGNYVWLGGTRDDAAGEAFDKTARLLGLPYPGGPEIEKSAKSGAPKAFSFPRPMIDSGDFDFSFSGLKTAVTNSIKTISKESLVIPDAAASIQEAIVSVLVTKTVKAANKFKVTEVVLAGGVAANQRLRKKMQSSFTGKVLAATPSLSVDNAAMIAAAAYFNYKPVTWQKIKADPGLHF